MKLTLGKIDPPFHTWVKHGNGEWVLESSYDNQVWTANIDHPDQIGYSQSWAGMIEVHADSKEMAVFLAQQIIAKLSDPKVEMLIKLKMGDLKDLENT